MSEAPLMLGVSGLRGIVGQSLTPEVAARFAGAFAGWLIESRPRPDGRPVLPLVAVGYDGRLGGQELYHVVTASLQACGCDVISLGLVMTPSVGFVVDRTGASAGMVVTASHNPQEWNGIKVILRERGLRKGVVSASAPGRADAQSIIDRFRAGAPAWRGPEEFGFDWPCPFTIQHQDLVLGLMRSRRDLRRVQARRFRVALDTVAGSGMRWGEPFLTAAGCRVHELYPLEKFGGKPFPHRPEPLAENLVALCRAVKRTKSQVGFAQDPDADRLAIVDERGRYISEEYTLALATESLLAGAAATRGKRRAARADNVLVTNLSTSRMLDDLAAKYGARVVRTAVGEANVVEAMKREKAAGHRVVLGGEGNGGVIWPEVTYVRDSLSAMALVLALMARTGKKVSELVADIPAYAIEKRKVDLARKEDAAPAVEKIAAAYRDKTIDRQDGVRVDWTGRRAWLHVRASNTEPVMRLIAEAPTGAEARAILDEAARIIAG